MSTTTDRQSEHDDDRDTRAVELLRDLVSIGPANALGLRRRRPMADTATAHGSADGQGANEARLRRALELLCQGRPRRCIPPHPDDDDNVLYGAITELLALRAEVAAQRPVVEAVEREHIEERKQAAMVCPSCGGTGYVTGEYRFPDGRVHRQPEPCGDCRAC